MSWLPKKPQVYLGSFGPFLGKYDLGLRKYSIPLDSMDTHLYCVGRTKKGKSKFLEGLLYQLISNLGQGCGLIDPHGDLANNLLKVLAFQPQGSTNQPWLEDPENASRVIYCEPGRMDYFIPMNLLRCSFARSSYSIASN